MKPLIEFNATEADLLLSRTQFSMLLRIKATRRRFWG